MKKLPESNLPSGAITTQISRKLVSPCKVLVIDDNGDNRTLLIEYLKNLGFDLQEAENGKEGIAIALEFQPDLILIDLVMPVMSGRKMLAELSQKSYLPDAIKLIITANIQPIKFLLLKIGKKQSK